MPKRSRMLAIVVLTCLVLSFFVGLAFWMWYTPEQKVIPIQLEVKQDRELGFNTGKDMLYFGTISPEGYSERKTTIVSAQARDAVIRIEGPVASWISVSSNDILLAPGEPHDIIFRATAPYDAKPGNYTGMAVISYHRVLW